MGEIAEDRSCDFTVQYTTEFWKAHNMLALGFLMSQYSQILCCECVCDLDYVFLSVHILLASTTVCYRPSDSFPSY